MQNRGMTLIEQCSSQTRFTILQALFLLSWLQVISVRQSKLPDPEMSVLEGDKIKEQKTAGTNTVSYHTMSTLERCQP